MLTLTVHNRVCGKAGEPNVGSSAFPANVAHIPKTAATY